MIPALSIATGRATPEEFPRLIEIHRNAIPYSFNSRLGTEHMKLLYDAVLADSGSAILVARVDEQPAGVCIATVNATTLSRKLLRRFPFHHFLNVASAIARSPRLLLNYLESAWISRPLAGLHKSVDACLVAIAVDEAFRNLGIGRRLIMEVDTFCRQSGCFRYRLDTRADNRGAQNFYRREGFTHVGTRGRNTLWVRDLARD